MGSVVPGGSETIANIACKISCNSCPDTLSPTASPTSSPTTSPTSLSDSLDEGSVRWGHLDYPIFGIKLDNKKAAAVWKAMASEVEQATEILVKKYFLSPYAINLR
jgi:hypothetical protein